MTPSARVQAAIEILDSVIAGARSNGAPADRIIAEWFRTRRFAGSSDRRAVRELAYAAIRKCGEVPHSGRAAMLTCAKDDPALAALFDGSTHAPAAIDKSEKYARPGLAPAWLEKLLTASEIDGETAVAMLGRAPLDIRINTLKASRDTVELPIGGEATLAKNALRLPPGTNVEPWPAYNTGQIEIQDTASQLVCEAVAARPGELVIDLCAGAGGKTLALGAMMENSGTLLACDTDRGRLARLTPRAERAGISIAETLLLNPLKETAALAQWQGKADAVLIDAPCSGSGTWRRSPDGRWRLTKPELEKLVKLQARLLDLAAGLLRPGGRLIYATCSLLDAEGPDQIAAFLDRNTGWRADAPVLPAGSRRGSGLRLTPFHDDTDGFFIARLLPI